MAYEFLEKNPIGSEVMDYSGIPYTVKEHVIFQCRSRLGVSHQPFLCCEDSEGKLQ